MNIIYRMAAVLFILLQLEALCFKTGLFKNSGVLRNIREHTSREC